MDSQIRYEPHHDQRVFTHGLDSPQPHPPTRNKRKLAGRGQGRRAGRHCTAPAAGAKLAMVGALLGELRVAARATARAGAAGDAGGGAYALCVGGGDTLLADCLAARQTNLEMI